jgi:hypothetical protein
MENQTAIEWLVEQIFNDVDLKDSILKLAIQQAKEKEKEQIMDAYIMGSYDMAAKEFKPEQYYNEIYNK